MPGTFVSVEFDLGIEKEAFMVPASAVIPVLKGQKVYVLRNGKVEEEPVELGIRTADQVQVIGNLKQGDEVLISALLAVKPGMPAQIKSK
jgi:membrane fusion protein (multidrug efflux system)